MHKILIIDDNAALCRTIAKMVSKLRMTAAYAHTLSEGLVMAEREAFDIVFLDVNLPDGNGLESIGKLRSKPFSPEVIIITAYGDRNGAEIAIKNGVWDYIEKGTSLQNIRLALTRAIEYRKNKKDAPQRMVLKRQAIVGDSQEITQCLEQVALAANTDFPVLITGETGTGKELFARAIHENSRVSTGNFVVVDCAALPDHLVESILFGHKKGSFTDAYGDYGGLILQADQGTLFLDEIGELPMEIQKKFLRVIQEKHFRPVGGKTEVNSDFRLVCATHRNLGDMIAQGKFRQDLYYRIRSMLIDLPPLRSRIQDIPALVMGHNNRNTRKTGERPQGFSPDFMEALENYSWPGNVRELFNTMDRVFSASANEPILFPKHLPMNVRAEGVRRKIKNRKEDVATAHVPGDFDVEAMELAPMKAFLETMKQRYVAKLMQIAQGDIASACRISGLSRAYLYQLVHKYDIRP